MSLGSNVEYRFTSLLGYFVLMGIAWLLSSDHKKFPWRVMWVASGLQLIVAWLMLRTSLGDSLFGKLKVVFDALLGYSDRGAAFLFGERFREHFFAFKVLPTIIFVSVSQIKR